MNKKTYLIEKAEKGLTIQQYLKQIAGFSNAQKMVSVWAGSGQE